MININNINIIILLIVLFMINKDQILKQIVILAISTFVIWGIFFLMFKDLKIETLISSLGISAGLNIIRTFIINNNKL